MRVGILAKGGREWLGGLYYTLNLIRTLRCLPRREQPHISLIVPHGYDVEQFKEIEPEAEICTLERDPSETATTAAVNPALVGILRDRGIDLIYPCMRSMGPSYPTSWLPWIPDLQHRRSPEYFDALECQQRDRRFHRMAADAELIVFSSRCALEDFDTAYTGCREKLRVLQFATVYPSAWLGDNPAETVLRYQLPQRYLILPNQFWAHKNHRVAFEAVRILAGRGVDVCVVCTGHTSDPRRPGHFADLRAYIDDNRLNQRIRVLGLLPRRDQIQLMRAAWAVVQPSLFEGWSTVVEDGRALGKRMFLSDIPVHREQDPKDAIFFDPHDPVSLADEIERGWALRPCGHHRHEEQAIMESQCVRVRRVARNFIALASELLQLRSSVTNVH